MNRSRENHPDGPSIWVEPNLYEKPRSKRDLRHKRARSGQWEGNKSLVAPPTPNSSRLSPAKRMMTQSAPDLLELVSFSAVPDNTVYINVFPEPPVPYNDTSNNRAPIARSSTVPGNQRGGSMRLPGQTGIPIYNNRSVPPKRVTKC